MADNSYISNSDLNYFIKKIAIVFLIVLTTMFLGDYVFSYYLCFSNISIYDRWTKILNAEYQDADLLIFGDSRAFVQYDPTIIDSILSMNSYNMGMDAAGCDRQIARWNLYKLYKNKKPKYIIQDIDYVLTLSRGDGYQRNQFFPFFWNAKFSEILFATTDSFSVCERYIPLYRYSNYGFKNVLLEENHNVIKGFESKDRMWNGSDLLIMDSIKFAYDKNMAALFEKYLQETLADSIKVIFVMSPIYYGTKDKFIQLDSMYSTYKRMSEKYNIPLLDYSYCELSKDTTLFYNALHLNKNGAELFTTLLSNDLKEMGIVDTVMTLSDARAN